MTAPIFIHAADGQWVQYPTPAVRLWQGERRTVLPDVTLINTGGHFEGATAALERRRRRPRPAAHRGFADRRHGPPLRQFYVQLPESILLLAQAVRRIAASVRPFAFERIYGAWDGRVVRSHGNEAVERGAERDIRHLQIQPPALPSALIARGTAMGVCETGAAVGAGSGASEQRLVAGGGAEE